MTYQHSLDGRTCADCGEAYKAVAGNFYGDMIGAFNYNNRDEAGHVDVNWFRYEVSNHWSAFRRVSRRCSP